MNHCTYSTFGQWSKCHNLALCGIIIYNTYENEGGGEVKEETNLSACGLCRSGHSAGSRMNWYLFVHYTGTIHCPSAHTFTLPSWMQRCERDTEVHLCQWATLCQQLLIGLTNSLNPTHCFHNMYPRGSSLCHRIIES